MSAPVIGVTYHCEGGAWWAEATAVPGWYAAADSQAECRQLAREGLAFHLGHAVEITDAGVFFSVSTQ